jgi:hypothetical protein
MIVRPRLVAVFLLVSIAAGCGGGGGGSNPAAANPPAANPPASPPPVVNKSPGGIWHGFSTNNEAFTFFVAETGDLRSLETKGAAGANPPLFGSGAVIVNAGDQLAGAYDSGRPFSAFTEHCEFTGTLSERVSMSMTLECTDGAGVKRSAPVIMGYDSDYDGGSALATIAGNYQFTLRPTNFLNIDGNGVIFGMYDNGPKCTVNGTVKLVDPRYNLYRFEWQLSLCQPPLLKFEGATVIGFAVKDPRGTPAGSFLALLTGIVDGHLEGVSLLYAPP